MGSDILRIELSEAMQQRIAAGEVRVDAQKVTQLTDMVARYLVGERETGNPFQEALQKAMRQGHVDAQATVVMMDMPRPRSLPLLHYVVRYAQHASEVLNDEAMLQWLVAHERCDVKDDRGVPAFHRAFMRSHDRLWDMMVKKPEFDVEMSYRLQHDGHPGSTVYLGNQILNYPAIPPTLFEGTIIEHECLRARRAADYHSRFSPEFCQKFDAAKLLSLGAVVPPEGVEWMETGEQFQKECEARFESLQQAITQRDGAKVSGLLQHGAAAHGFSLGHGRQMCRKEFWGEFWTQGRAAMLSLPEWAKHRLVHEMMAMVKDAMPDPVVRDWSHALLEPQEKAR